MNDKILAAQFRAMLSPYHQARTAAEARRYDQPVPYTLTPAGYRAAQFS